jgi:RNA polymerase sigma factor (sigma-70 family)
MFYKLKEGAVTIEDYTLIRQIKKGDKNAFDTLVRKYYQNIYSYCVRRIGNQVVAADLTQDIFLKLSKAIYDYNFSGKFINFLFTIAVNTCNDYFRKPHQAYENIENLQKGDDKSTPIEDIIRNEQAMFIKQKIDELPDIQKDTIILYYYNDIKLKDIAKIMGVNLSTVKSRLKQGKDKLKKIFSEENYFER